MTDFEDFQLKISGQNYVILRTIFVEPVTCVNIAMYYNIAVCIIVHLPAI